MTTAAGREQISACLIVENEQERLPAALDSVAFCDEVIVVDGGSRDDTVALARSHGANVVENPWPGFAAQRNVALDAASGDWVLEIDADERVTPALRAAIERLLSGHDRGVQVAVCPLRNRFLGGSLGPSAKYPAYRTRLFRRGAYRHDEARQVHEGIEPRERPFVLEGDLEHELASSWKEALLDAWRYAKLESAHLSPPRRGGAYAVGILARPLAKAAYRLAVDGGWRDGWRGFVKVGLDAGSDALVWVMVLLRGSQGTQRDAPRAPGADAGHFGRRPSGPAKVIALAGRGASSRRAQSWLAELAGAGLDVVLVCSEPPPGARIPVRRVGRLGPLAAMRAIDVEMQLRTAHAVVAFGRRARLVRRLLPGALGPRVAGVEQGTQPQAAIERLQQAVRRP